VSKWRLPADGEEITGPVFCETAIASDVAAPAATVDSLLDRIDQALPAFDPLPFETSATNSGRARPGGIPAAVRRTDKAAARIGRRAVMMALAQLGTVSSALMVLIRHQSGEREGLNADGSQREFGQLAVA
jgi:hypothetical protein